MSDLAFEALTVRYGTGRKALAAVDNVSLRVPHGQVMGLVGESGSGKSSLARAAFGLVPISSGRVTIGGTEVRGVRRKDRARIQMIFQDPYASLDPRMSVGRSIAEALPPGEHDRRARRSEVARLLELVNLDPDRAGVLPARLSGGQRQRVAIARALAARPSVIVADEITSALDVSVQGSVLNLIRDLHATLGLTILFISHNLSVVRYISDQLAVMYSGTIVETGPTDDVLSDPRHPYTRELFTASDARRIRSRAGAAHQPVDGPRDGAALTAEPPDPTEPPAGCRYHPRCAIGPRVLTGHDLCTTADPRIGSAERPHRASCHFAGEPLTTNRAGLGA